MKTLIIALSLYFSPTNYSSFCDGWEDGYCAGWRAVKGEFAMCPLAPICPIPPLGCDSENYRCGFTQGVVAGQKAAYRGW